jgi:hypothetical protein
MQMPIPLRKKDHNNLEINQMNIFLTILEK